MNRDLALKIWGQFFWRFLVWFLVAEVIASVCFYILPADRHHPSRFLVILHWAADFGILAFTSYSALKSVLFSNFEHGTPDA